jgi:galactonate dehydratase
MPGSQPLPRIQRAACTWPGTHYDAGNYDIGLKNDLLVDVHSKFDLKRGLELLRRMEPLQLLWIEEVTPAQPIDDLAAINRAASMPTAGGEMIYGIRGFYPYVVGKAVKIVMPDVKYCGGMLELKKIASLAEAADLLVSPHGPASPVGNVTAAHVCAGMPNFLILEHSFGEVPWRAELIDPRKRSTKATWCSAKRPGLGITLNAKVLTKYRVE